MVPDGKMPHMDVAGMEVLEAQVLHPETSQFIQIEGVLDLPRQQTAVRLYAASANGTRNTDKPFATATVCYEEAPAWQDQWQMTSHLVAARANSFWEMAAGGSDDNARPADRGGPRVSNFFCSIAYQLFANVVDYGARYRGMQRVALSEGTLEATADIVLDKNRHGTWHTPPHWIDSAFQLAGFVMNSFGVQGDGKISGSSRDFFYITPGWRHFRLLERLEPGPEATYRSFVRMIPVDGEPGAYSGDIYLHRGERLVGVCAGIKFKAVPRALMPVLFPRIEPQAGKRRNQAQTAENRLIKGKGNCEYTHTVFQEPKSRTPAFGVTNSQPHAQPSDISISQKTQPVAAVPVTQPALPANEKGGQNQGQSQSQNAQATACLSLISDETGLDLDDSTGEAAFADLGVDSLMSLALSAKIRAELGIDVQSSSS